MTAAGGWTVAQAVGLPRVAPAGGVAQVVAHTGMVLAAALFAALALGAVPKFEGTKERAYLASMKSDLRNLVTAEEAYFADSTHFTTNLGTSFATTSNVTGPEIKITATGWTAKVGHTTTIYTCAIFVAWLAACSCFTIDRFRALIRNRHAKTGFESFSRLRHAFDDMGPRI